VAGAAAANAARSEAAEWLDASRTGEMSLMRWRAIPFWTSAPLLLASSCLSQTPQVLLQQNTADPSPSRVLARVVAVRHPDLPARTTAPTTATTTPTTATTATAMELDGLAVSGSALVALGRGVQDAGAVKATEEVQVRRDPHCRAVLCMSRCCWDLFGAAVCTAVGARVSCRCSALCPALRCHGPPGCTALRAGSDAPPAVPCRAEQAGGALDTGRNGRTYALSLLLEDATGMCRNSARTRLAARTVARGLEAASRALHCLSRAVRNDNDCNDNNNNNDFVMMFLSLLC
jgi:hypothetical protein